jgi:hypothetical protein
MVSRTRGGAALQNEVALLNKQLMHVHELTAAKNNELAAKDRELAAKSNELAAKDGELQSVRLLQQLARQVRMPDVGPGEHAKKHARLADDSRSPLADDQILDTVFSYVGIGDYIYTGAVSRRWNGRYTKLCCNKAKEGRKDKLITAHKSALCTAARLQLALRSSLKILALQKNKKFSEHVIRQSLNPIAVLTLARVHGLQWQPQLATFCVMSYKRQVLQWLHESGCPWDGLEVSVNAARGGSIDMLIWVRQVTAPWR